MVSPPASAPGPPKLGKSEADGRPRRNVPDHLFHAGDMEPPFEHEPGSPEAIAQGCTCPPQSGPGAVIGSDGTPGFICEKDCPIHGIEVVKRALAAGWARIVQRDEPTRH